MIEPVQMLPTIIVSGTRHAEDLAWCSVVDRALRKVCNSTFPDAPFHLVHGAAHGIDSLADIVGRRRAGWTVTPVPAKWHECGDLCPATPHKRPSGVCPYAGHRRNQLMLDSYPYAEVLAMPLVDDSGRPLREMSRGTWDTIERALLSGRTVTVEPIYIRGKLW